MDLLFQFVEETPVKDTGTLLLRSNNDRIRFFDVRELLVSVSRDDVVRYTLFEDLAEFFTLLGIRPQNEDRVRHSCPSDPIKTRTETISRIWFSDKTKKPNVSRAGE